MQKGVLPLEAITDSVEMYLGTRPSGAGAVYRVLLVALALAMAALPLVRVEVSASGRGFIRPEVEKHDITLAVGGTIARIRARRGQEVRRGDTLLAIGSTQLSAHAAVLQSEIAELRRDSIDLAILTTLDANRLPANPLGERFAPSLARLLGEESSFELRIESARSRSERSRALLAQQLVSRAEVEEREGELRAIRADAVLVRERYLSEWQEARRSNERELERLRLELSQLTEDLEQYVVRSPIDGTLEELASVSEGSYLPAGSHVAVVSPTAGLVGEILVRPDDVAAIDPGTPVRLAVDAFDYREWGFITGLVTDLSRDFIMVDGQPYFRAQIGLTAVSLRQPTGTVGKLRKGMTVSARFHLAERSVWNLIWDTTADWLNPYQPTTRLAE